MPTSTRPPRAKRYTLQSDLHPDLKTGSYYYHKFYAQPLLFRTTAGFPVNVLAADTNINTDVMMLPLGSNIAWDYRAHSEEDLIPAFDNTNIGLDIAGDITDNDAIELVPGRNISSSPLLFKTPSTSVVGDSAFFIKAKFKLTDADGSDQFVVGFRKQEAYQAPTSFLTTGDALYTDFFGVGFATNPVTNPNLVVTTSDIANAGSSTVTSTGFTWADGVVHTLEVRVIANKAIVLINGVRIGNPIAKDGDGGAITSQTTLSGPSYTFGSGLSLIPFIFLRHDAAVSNGHLLREIEIGHLVTVGLDPNAE